MESEVKWETEPILRKVLARTGRVRIGAKELRFPFRATSIGKNTSEMETILNATGKSIPKKTIVTHYLKMDQVGINYLTHTNGRFTSRKNEVNEILSRLSDESVRMVYARIPQGDERDKEKRAAIVRKISKDESKALFDFLNGISNNDVLLIPVPPRIEDADALDPILSGWKERIETVGTQKPIMAYIPAVSDPVLARKIVEKYIKSDFNFRMFAVDLSYGHAERTTMEVVSTLIGEWKAKRLEDFYLHALDVRHFYDINHDSAAVEDMFVHIMGFDSFNNKLYPTGGPKKPKSSTPQKVIFENFNKNLRYWYDGDYGGHKFTEAVQRAKKKECTCPVCKNHDIDEIYRELDNDRAYKLLRAHHIFSELVSEKDQTEYIRAGTLDEYLYQKEIPNRSGLTKIVQQNIRSIL